jgi:palmitoyl-protein thioesterase
MRVAVLLAAVAALCLLSAVSAVQYRPVVVMHGIGASNDTMVSLVSWITSTYPGIYVRNMEIGNGQPDSSKLHMDDQVRMFCENVASDPHLANGFNLLGYSQGSLVTRGYIERCDVSGLVYNYITLGGIHEGVFSAPYVSFLPKEIFNVLSDIVYEDWFQHGNYSFAGYWKDPKQYDKYLAKSSFLADINNERDTKNPDYKKRLSSLNTFVMVDSTHDYIVFPIKSGWFQFFAVGSTSNVVDLKDSDTYKGDWLGLRTLDEAGKLHFYTATCTHPDYPDAPDEDFFRKNILQYFNNALDGWDGMKETR